MTRASLLHVLDPSTTLGLVEVRELEQLAQAFPYCQTAHLLLAKAAHDQGAMLAGQRLRRAATYAADRALLRRLIETTPLLGPAVEPMPEPVPAVAAPALLEAVVPQPARFVAPRPAMQSEPSTPDPAEALPSGPAVKNEPEEPVPSAHSLDIIRLDASTAHKAESLLPTPVVAPVDVAAAVSGSPTPKSGVLSNVAGASWAISSTANTGTGTPLVGVAGEATGDVAVPSPPEPGLPVPNLGITPPATDVVAQPATGSAENDSAAAESSVTIENNAVAENSPAGAENLPATEIKLLADADAHYSTNPAVAPETPLEPALEAPNTPVAPPVRPPAEAGAARFEYGLAQELEPTPAYLLPGLSDEWTWTLPPKPFVQPPLTPAAFLGDETVGYGWGESTRLGLALMPFRIDEQADTSGPAAFALPLPNDFFTPDALLQQHWAEHQPKALPPPTSLELIETFLRQKPRLTRPALAKTNTEAIADLAAPSTNAPPELVSESLARILARQGKLARAIEVYERLMVKHPEKMAYFATEIQSLQLQQPPLP